MPCDTIRTPQQIETALDKLRRLLREKRARVIIDKRTGAVAFAGWTNTDRNGVSDLCAYRKLIARGDADLRRALASAEAIAGRKVSRAALAAGIHSHNGGASFGPE